MLVWLARSSLFARLSQPEDMPKHQYNYVSCQQASGKSASLSSGGLASLLVAILQLRMDPACNILAVDLQVILCKT